MLIFCEMFYACVSLGEGLSRVAEAVCPNPKSAFRMITSDRDITTGTLVVSQAAPICLTVSRIYPIFPGILDTVAPLPVTEIASPAALVSVRSPGAVDSICSSPASQATGGPEMSSDGDAFILLAKECDPALAISSASHLTGSPSVMAVPVATVVAATVSSSPSATFTSTTTSVVCALPIPSSTFSPITPVLGVKVLRDDNSRQTDIRQRLRKSKARLDRKRARDSRLQSSDSDCVLIEGSTGVDTALAGQGTSSGAIPVDGGDDLSLCNIRKSKRPRFDDPRAWGLASAWPVHEGPRCLLLSFGHCEPILSGDVGGLVDLVKREINELLLHRASWPHNRLTGHHATPEVAVNHFMASLAEMEAKVVEQDFIGDWTAKMRELQLARIERMRSVFIQLLQGLKGEQ